MIKKILLVVVVVVCCVLLYATTKPSTMHIERTATINAPPEKIFPLIADFNSWSSWSPYEKLDPNMKRSRSGAPSGVGAVYEWTGNMDVGSGRMEVIEAAAPSKVGIRLDFTKPMTAHDTALFTLVPSGTATSVTWAMDGPMNYMSKVMSVFMNMDKMVGNQFAEGLANLKTQAEK